MPCPSSGEIKISDLVTEFGGTAPHALSEYYRDAGLVPGNNTSVPTSGQFALTSCYSAVNEIQHTHSDGDTHVDYGTIFGSNWASTVPKRVIVPSGVTVGGTSTHAMNLPTGMGGTIVFDITGNVHGHGGAANGGAGGNAINCVQTTGVTINLNSGGTIKAGGGGGGAGGAGGTGGNGGAGGAGGPSRANAFSGMESQATGTGDLDHACNYVNQWNARGYGSYYSARSGINGSHYIYGYLSSDTLWRKPCGHWNYTNGGAGGAGGTSGGAGGAGGAGGYYITNRGSITFNNSGTVAGQ